MAHAIPGPTLAPQVLVCAKSPLATIEMMFRPDAPVFVKVTTRGALVEPTAWPENVSACGESVTTGARMPVPVKGMAWLPPAALSATVTAPALGPAAVGVNVTLIVQLLPLATLLPQLFVSPKSPLALIPLIDSGALPVLLKTTLCGALGVLTIWLVKVKLAGVNSTTGVGSPLPANGIVSGESDALSVIITEPYLFPAAVGVNVTLITQLKPAPKLAGQVLVCAKSPLVVTLVNVRAALPVFAKVTVCGAEVAPTD
jgi:hypothetical protein